jgi:hypothetical protein
VDSTETRLGKFAEASWQQRGPPRGFGKKVGPGEGMGRRAEWQMGNQKQVQLGGRSPDIRGGQFGLGQGGQNGNLRGGEQWALPEGLEMGQVGREFGIAEEGMMDRGARVSAPYRPAAGALGARMGPPAGEIGLRREDQTGIAGGIATGELENKIAALVESLRRMEMVKTATSIELRRMLTLISPAEHSSIFTTVDQFVKYSIRVSVITQGTDVRSGGMLRGFEGTPY